MSHDYWADLPELIHNWTESPDLKHSKRWRERNEFTRLVKLGENKDSSKRDAQRLDLPWYSCSEAFQYDAPGGAPPPLPFSLGITLHWQTTTPFFSRHDGGFDAFDNPLCRDRLTGRPVLRASGAKGMLRHAGEALVVEYPELWCRIMGTANDDDATGAAGRLVVGDVVFEGKIESDVIAPHDREWGVVRHPVFYETVAAKAKATWGFVLYQYAPGEFDMARAASAILRAAEFLITELGMSAKRNMGYGLGEELRVSLQPGSAFRLPEEDRKPRNPWPHELPSPPGMRGNEVPPRGEVYLHEDGTLCHEDKAIEFKARAICRESKQTSEKEFQIQIKKLSSKKVRDEWKAMKKYLESQSEEARREREQLVAIYEAACREKAAWESNPMNFSYAYETIEEAVQSLNRLNEGEI